MACFIPIFNTLVQAFSLILKQPDGETTLTIKNKLFFKKTVIIIVFFLEEQLKKSL